MVLSTGFVTRTSALYIDFLPSNPRIPAPPADIIAIALRSHSPRALGNSSRWQCNHHSHPYNNIYLRHNHRCMRLSGLTSYVTSRLPRLRSRLLPSAMQHERQADVDDPSTAVSVLVDASQSKHGSTTHSYRHKRPPHSGQGILALLGVALLWGTFINAACDSDHHSARTDRDSWSPDDMISNPVAPMHWRLIAASSQEHCHRITCCRPVPC
jgi:hypothetical protein